MGVYSVGGLFQSLSYYSNMFTLTKSNGINKKFVSASTHTNRNHPTILPNYNQLTVNPNQPNFIFDFEK